MPLQDMELNLVVVGDHGVGKTSFIKEFSGGNPEKNILVLFYWQFLV